VQTAKVNFNVLMVDDAGLISSISDAKIKVRVLDVTPDEGTVYDAVHTKRNKSAIEHLD
jgi:hypothetical protein